MENYCQIGTPVQFFEWKEESTQNPPRFISGWETQAAVISSLNNDKTKVNIQVFPSKKSSPLGILSSFFGKPSHIIENVRHSDFSKNGENFWNYIPKEQP